MIPETPGTEPPPEPRATMDPAERLARAIAALPEPGRNFLSFQLEVGLGRGAFSRVFLARQTELGNRPVVLKVAVDLFDEPRTLAQLQHTNIVPIYSLHSASPLHAICMPYFGRTTLADVLAALAGRSIPLSGEFLVSMLRGTVLHDSAVAVRAPAGSDIPLERLARQSYIEAILSMTARLAQGLAHAHERGIVHRDLKPANILISDEGQPMLLDFNLSTDSKVRAPRQGSPLGGTLPYMAPEHLEAFQGGERPVDARSDIYAMGVILYESLTGRLPFAMSSGKVSEVIPRLIAARPAESVEVRSWNPAVTPAVEAIVRRCLAHEPDQRYQSAADLAEDIQLHLNNLPLRYTAEPSLGERLGKWARRHPRLTARSTMAMAAIIAVFALLIFSGWIERRQFQKELVKSREEELTAKAWSTFRDFQALLPKAVKLQGDLIILQRHYGAGILPDDVIQEGLSDSANLLDLYDVLGKPAWQKQPLIDALPLRAQEEVRDKTAAILFFCAQAFRQEARLGGGEADGSELLRKAWKYNERALESLPAEHVFLHGITAQQLQLARRLNKAEEAARAKTWLNAHPPRNTVDFFLAAFELTAAGKLQEAVQLLRQKVLADMPGELPASLLLAVCLHNLAEYSKNPEHFEEAIGAYNTSVALGPAYVTVRLERGWLYVSNPTAKWELARADADFVLANRPDWSLAHLLYARSIEEEVIAKCQGKAVEAKVEDECRKLIKNEGLRHVERAIEARPNDPAVYFLKAKLEELAGDKEKAGRDLAKVLEVQPHDAEAWAFRGRARLRQGDQSGKGGGQRTEQALQDFDQALKRDRRCLAALFGKARVLASTGQPAAALETLEKTIVFYPDFLDAHAERGLLLAREQKFVPAYREAIVCRHSAEPRRYYQAAQIFAQAAKAASPRRPPDAPHALKLLAFALRNGYGWDRFADDPDFAPLRADPEFQRLVQSASIVARGVPPRMRLPEGDK